jgi:hypothetical protein
MYCKNCLTISAPVYCENCLGTIDLNLLDNTDLAAWDTIVDSTLDRMENHARLLTEV